MQNLNHINAKLALEASGIGTWSLNTVTGEMHIDPIAAQLLGLPAYPLTFRSIFNSVHPDDKVYAEASLQAGLLSGRLHIKFRRDVPADRPVKWVELRGGKTDEDTFFGTVQDVTDEAVRTFTLLDNDARLRNMIEESPVAICLFLGRELKVEVINQLMLDYWGKDRGIVGLPLVEALPELIGQPFLKIFDDVYTSGIAYTDIEAGADLPLNGVWGTYYFDFTYKPLFNTAGEVYGILETATNVTERVLSKRRQQASESRFRTITEQSPMAIGVLKGRDMVIEIGNDRIFQVWGKDPSITGMHLIDALPEIKGQQFISILEKVYDTGQPYYGYDVLAKLEFNGRLRDVYFDFIYSALRDENNQISGVLVLASDVTQRVLTLKKIAESEAKFRALMQAAPSAMVLFKGDELIIDMHNQAFLDIVGRDDSVGGKPLLEAIPEIEGQDTVKFLREAFATGKQRHSYGRQVTIIKNNAPTNNYYNVSYTPLLNAEGEVYAVLDTAIDVTESIMARKAIEEAEASLRGAIDLADLATWSLDPETMVLTYSEKLLEWFGLPENGENVQKVLDILHEDDRERVTKSLLSALEPESDGTYDEEYTIINRINGRERVLHAQGKTFYSDDGKPYILRGTAQDITNQKRTQLALENEVKARTEELYAANRQLTASNEELAQYAYVASHDLQEPLRKITMFSNLLSQRNTETEHQPLIEKITKASQRMSLLIKDLLEFSRLLSTDTRYIETDLNTIVNAVKEDFELLVQEKDAVLESGQLPVINAVPLQMNQLFYNLISNALKFVPQDRKPHIVINCELAENALIEEYIHNADKLSKYYRISIRDNGIGIEEQYAKQIFDVFKRLHARDEFSGSGIGLAICRRIVINHNGAIYIESVVGEGTTFNIILPERQLTTIV